jgi:glycerophosphoryl diester phosphodiesterase
MSNRPLLLGHRGARAVKSLPENTLASFDRALADGCDGFEFDVRISTDGEAVVCHDSRLGGTEISTATAKSLAHLPRLKNVIRRYQSNAFLDIELKVPGLEQLTVELLREHPPQRGFVVSSFLPEVLRNIAAADSAIPLGLICEVPAELELWRELPLEYVIPHQRLLRRELLSNIQRASRKVLVWTVNNPEDMKRLAEWGVNGILSDDTQLLVKTVEN